jgi:alpha-tubulin suppressor-like RCC1 family protein
MRAAARKFLTILTPILAMMGACKSETGGLWGETTTESTADGGILEGGTITRGDSGPFGFDGSTPGKDAGTTVDANTPIVPVTQVSVGEFCTCAVLTSGTLKCFGGGESGDLGLGDTNNRGDKPGEMGAALPGVSLGTGRKAKFAANNGVSCAILDDNSTKCWGHNTSGELGQGDMMDRGGMSGQMGDNLPAIDLGPGRTATSLAVGVDHVCAILDDKSVKCWGRNADGQLGYGDIANRGNMALQMGVNLPSVDLGPGRTAKAISASNHTCAILDDDTVKCWGQNLFGQLGLGDTNDRGNVANQMGVNLPTVDLGPGRTAKAIAAGFQHTCAVLDDGTVKCWGLNLYGQLGLGDTVQRGDKANEMGANLPTVDFGAGRVAIAIAAGFSHSCALFDDSTVKCWGQNGDGQLGVGDFRNRGETPGDFEAGLPPVSVGTGRLVTSLTIHGNARHTCVLLDDQSVKCWGFNGEGELGYGDDNDRGYQPAQMGDALPHVSF